MLIDKISPGENPPWDINVIIEIPIGGVPVKYEVDKDSGAMIVDRFLHTAMHYPCNYGFIPHTLADDGDPVDALVVGNLPIIPGAVIRCRPIGVLVMEDDAGQDEKIISVPSPHLTRRYENIHEFSDLPEITLDQIEHFFEHYKDLEPTKWVKIGDWKDAEAARQMIIEAIARAKES